MGSWISARTWVVQDKVVADVGGTPITLRETRVMASLIKGRTVAFHEKVLLKNAIMQLVEQEIIWKEIKRNNRMIPSIEFEKKLRHSFLSKAGDRRHLENLLTAFDVGEKEWQALIQRQAMILEYVTVQFQPEVYVSPEETLQYYQEEFLPSLADGAVVPPVATVRIDIEGILRQRKINKELFNWINRRKKELKVKFLFEE